jgi:uncharacterized protein with HEPN domain
MQRDVRAYLWDMREASQAIQDFISDMNAATYASTPLVHSAVERKFEIIGEALNQLAKLDPALAARIPHHPQIIAFRNQLIHGYAVINHETVWNVTQTELHTLLDAVKNLMDELETD